MEENQYVNNYSYFMADKDVDPIMLRIFGVRYIARWLTFLAMPWAPLWFLWLDLPATTSKCHACILVRHQIFARSLFTSPTIFVYHVHCV